MFKSKKRGLRSFSNTLVLFVIILIIPLLILFVTRAFFSAPPIFPEYPEWIEKAKSDDNGYIFFSGADNIAKRMNCGYFSMALKSYIPDNPDNFVFSKGTFRVEKWPPEVYLSIYKFLIKENLFGEEMEAYTKQKYSFSDPINVYKRSCIYPEGNWIEEFKRNSTGILNSLKKANEKVFFLPYVSHPYDYYNVLDANIMLIELVNVLLLLQKGDYPSALDWIDTLNQFVLKIEPIYHEGPSPIGQQLRVIDMIATYPSLPYIFCEDLLYRLLEMKKEIKALEFKTVYQYLLFNLENAFARRQDILRYSAPYVSVPKSISIFLAYNNISRSLDKQKEVFETSTWNDIEDAIFYGKGKVFSAINEIKSIQHKSSDYFHEFWLFSSGEEFRRVLIKYNYSLCSIYGSIIKVLLEQYFLQNGVYPNNFNEMLNNYFTEEELNWIDDYLDIYISPEKYYIDYYPIPKKTRDSQKTGIFNYRDSYRIRAY